MIGLGLGRRLVLWKANNYKIIFTLIDLWYINFYGGGGLNYESYKQNALNFYSNVRKVFSPALNQNIHFTSEGFNHIIFKGSRLERERPSQILRFKLLPLAIKLLEIATTFQEYEQTIKDFQVMNYKKRSIKSKLISYWGCYRYY